MCACVHLRICVWRCTKLHTHIHTQWLVLTFHGLDCLSVSLINHSLNLLPAQLNVLIARPLHLCPPSSLQEGEVVRGLRALNIIKVCVLAVHGFEEDGVVVRGEALVYGRDGFSG